MPSSAASIGAPAAPKHVSQAAAATVCALHAAPFAIRRRAYAVTCDVQHAADLEAAFAVAANEFGCLDSLVNNAGVSSVNLAQLVAEEEWVRVVDTNLKAVFMGCKLAHPLFKARGRGKIINIGSEYSLFGSAFNASCDAAF